MGNISTSSCDQCISPTATQADIVIVNWNAGQQLIECLRSIEAFGGGYVASVVVVDNYSTDGSADGLEEQFNLPIRVVRNEDNRGFGVACNQGAALGAAPYVLFLNPDTRLFEGSLAKPLAFMAREDNANAGICGIQLVDEQGAVSRTCARSPGLRHFLCQALGVDKLPGLRGTGVHMKEWDHGDTRCVDHVIGAFYLMRRELFELLGGFDERFFVYLEDLDLSKRAKSAGWKTMYLADAQAFHAGGGTSRKVKAARLFYSLRSRLMYGFKHFSAWKAWLLLAVTCGLEPITRMVFCLLRGDWRGVVDTARGYRMLVAAVPSIAAGRGACR